MDVLDLSQHDRRPAGAENRPSGRGAGTAVRWTAVGLLASVAIGCGGAARMAGPADASASRLARAARNYTEADVRFMQHMIVHHAQALAMADLVPERTQREEIRRLAERITVSQKDEIAMMERWLRERGEAVASDHLHHATMPGMLSQEELDRLVAARGVEFDRLFLEFMIRHHEGALVMVRELFATPGAGEASEVYQLASEVDADQRMEIARMRALLAALDSTGNRE
jgi:uncharacterized protein (DUF305 family)